MLTPNFFFSGIAFLTSILASIYFLVLWFRYEKKHTLLLYWAVGFCFLLLFKMPNILANTPLAIVQRDLDGFFFVTFLLYFFVHLLFIEGLYIVRPFSHRRLFVTLGRIVFPLSVIYFFISFFVAGFGTNYAPIWFSNILFFIPAQLFLLFRLWTMAQHANTYPVISKVGARVAMIGVLALCTTSILYIAIQANLVQQKFWFLTVASSPGISVLQIITVVLLFFGFRAIALHYLQTTTKAV